MNDSPDNWQIHVPNGANTTQIWDARVALNNLSFLENKIHELRDLVQVIDARGQQATGQADEILVQQQHLINAGLTSILVELISMAGSLLPSLKDTLSSGSSISQLGQLCGDVTNQSIGTVNKVEDCGGLPVHVGTKRSCPSVEDRDMKSEDDAEEGENLPPGSYEILQLEKEEILVAHTHFCPICGKGFKRDANLRMHMRGHGDEYKTPAALANPNKESTSKPTPIRRYSCPFVGCKRNKEHKKFQPLKTILCVKNHYKRTHCDKTYTCSRCNIKKFSVVADLKTHEKHCGRDKWLCSCGTTFSRKDKLFGHVTLFQGHTPAVPMEEWKASADRPSDQGQCNKVINTVKQQQQPDYLCKSNNPSGSTAQTIMEVQEDPSAYYSPLGFETSSIAGFDEFESESSFSFLLSGACDYPPNPLQ